MRSQRLISIALVLPLAALVSACAPTTTEHHVVLLPSASPASSQASAIVLPSHVGLTVRLVTVTTDGDAASDAALARASRAYGSLRTPRDILGVLSGIGQVDDVASASTVEKDGIVGPVVLDTGRIDASSMGRPRFGDAETGVGSGRHEATALRVFVRPKVASVTSIDVSEDAQWTVTADGAVQTLAERSVKQARVRDHGTLVSILASRRTEDGRKVSALILLTPTLLHSGS